MALPKLLFPQSVSHRGVVVVFACRTESDGTGQAGDLYFNVLDLALESAYDDMDWAGFRPVPKRSVLRSASMSLLTVTDATGATAQGAWSIPAFPASPFVVLSDDLYICVFRQTSDGGLTMARFILVQGQAGDTGSTPSRQWQLSPAWEPRYQQTQRIDVPASRKDGVNFLNLDGDPFIEPIIGIAGVHHLTNGEFTVQLLPTQDVGIQRWQIFAIDRTPSQPEIEGFSIRCGSDGLFDYSDQELEQVTASPPTYRIKPSERFRLSFAPESGPPVPLRPTTGLSSTTYAKMENATNSLGDAVRLKRGLHLLLALGVEATPASPIPRSGSIATLDMAVTVEGRMAPVAEEMVLTRVDAQSYAISFDGQSAMLIEQPTPLALSGSFTLQAWVCLTQDAFQRSPVLGGTSQSLSTLAPTLWIEQYNRIGFGSAFSGGKAEVTYLETLSSPIDAIATGAWCQISVVFDGTRLTFYVNGVAVYDDPRTFAGKMPFSTPVSTIGEAFVKVGAGVALQGMGGSLDEVRLWGRALDDTSIQATLFRRLRADERTGLLAYWDFEAPDNDGPARVPDVSGNGHVGTLDGAAWVPSTAPTSIVNAGRESLSEQGLSTIGGVLSFGVCASTPRLFGSADGLVHLYFEAAGLLDPGRRRQSAQRLAGIDYQEPMSARTLAGQFSVAQYDSSATRASFSAKWHSSSATGSIEFVARASGSVMNEAVVVIEAGSTPDLCNVELRVRPESVQGVIPPFQAVFETWRNVPRELRAFEAVLSGQASSQWNSPEVQSGARLYYAYDGIDRSTQRATRAVCRVPVGRGHLRFESARRDVALSKIDLVADGADHCTAQFEFVSPRGIWRQVWPKVPLAAGRFVEVMSGMAGGYAYGAPGAGSMKAWSLQASGGHSVLLLTNNSSITTLKATIGPSTSRNPATCKVDIQAGKLGAAWDEVPRLQIIEASGAFTYSFVSVLSNKTSQPGGYNYCRHATGSFGPISDALHVTDDGYAAMVGDGIAAEADLRSWGQLVSLIDEHADDRVTAQAYPADFVQGATSNDTRADLARGSALFGVVVSFAPPGGETGTVDDIVQAKRSSVGVSAGWIYEPPRNAVDFVEAAWGTVNLSRPQAERLNLPSTLTAEAWFKSTELTSAYPRILQYSAPAGSAGKCQYAIGLKRLPALRRDPGDGDVFCKNDTSLQLTAQTFTAEGWLRVTTAAQTLSLFDYAPGDDSVHTIGLVFGKLDVRLGGRRVIGTTVWTPGQWRHLAVVKDGNAIRLYVNGRPEIVREVATGLGGQTGLTVAPGLYLCGRCTHSYRSNELRLWKTARTDREIRSAFNQYVDATEITLQGYWRLDQLTGTVVRNLATSTGTRNDGEISGSGLVWDAAGCFANPIAAANHIQKIATQTGVSADTWHHLAMAYRSGTAVTIGDDDSVDAGNNATLDFPRELTVEAWVIRSGAGGGDIECIVSKWGVDVAGRAFQFGTTKDGKPIIKAQLDDEALTPVALVAENPLTPGAHYLSATMKSTVVSTPNNDNPPTATSSTTITLVLYVDGVAVKTSITPFAGSVGFKSAESSLLIGAQKRQTPVPDEINNFKGSISDVRLWNKALAPGVFQEAFTSRSVPDADGLVSFWSFAEQTGRTTKDLVGNNNATLSSSGLWARFAATAVQQVWLDGQPVSGLTDLAPDWGGYGAPQLSVAAGKDAQGVFQQPFDGLLDSIRIWKSFRTREQILDDIYRPVAGNEEHLVASWECNAGSGDHIDDGTGQGNTVMLQGNWRWAESDAPISNEAPLVTNALGGIATSFAVGAGGTPAVVEYGDTQLDANGQLVSVMKRCYVYRDGDAIRYFSGFKIGDLDTVYIGQVQTAPTLIGYIEGPPPVPSENLTVDSEAGAPNAYAGASAIKLVDADEVSYGYSMDYESGFDMSMELGVGLAVKSEETIGLGFYTSLTWLESKFGGKFTMESSEGIREGGSLTSTGGDTVSDAVSIVGEWEAQADGRWANPAIGRRYLPANLGYGLVRSSTADRYATRLRSTGAFVSSITRPNPQIPPDSNIIAFPINPRYVKNGTLDGKVGFDNDPDYPDADAQRGSYFKPVEAYALKRDIEMEQQRLAADYAQFEAASKGKGYGKDGLSLDDMPSDRLYDRTNQLAKRSLVNSYVWSASGGFHAEQQQYTSVRTESNGGYRSFSGKAGLHAEFGFVVKLGIYTELDLLFGGHYQRSIIKTETSSNTHSMDAEVTGERFLKTWDDALKRYSQNPTPGKVDTYRFMSFFLAPATRNFDDFFATGNDSVVDPYWLARSSEPGAVALREARGNTNKVWRILHRVTFVSRIPPQFRPSPVEATAPSIDPPIRMGANWELLTLVGQLLMSRGQLPSPTPAQIGAAVSTVLETQVDTELAWWAGFQAKKDVAGSAARQQYATILDDCVNYLISYYQSKSLLGI